MGERPEKAERPEKPSSLDPDDPKADGPESLYLLYEGPSASERQIRALAGASETVWVDLVALFEALGLKVEQKGAVASGFFADPSRPYRLDARSGAARVSGKPAALPAGAFRYQGGRIYVQPPALGDLFGLAVHLDRAALSFEVDYEGGLLPVERREAARKRRATLSAKGGSAPTEAPLLYPYRREVFQPGVLDYGVNTMLAGEEVRTSLRTRGGAELFGGDLLFDFAGAFSGQTRRLYSSSARYRYALPDDPYLREFSLGAVYVGGVRGTGFSGVRVTNRPPVPEEVFATRRVSGPLPPGWVAEAYVNGQFVGFQRVGDTGRYDFEVPLGYGSTRLTLRLYGPYGEVRTEVERLRIPAAFAPAGTLYYTAGGGWAAGGQTFGSDGRALPVVKSKATYGVTSNISVTGGVDYAAPDRGPDAAGLTLEDAFSEGYLLTYGGLAARYGSLVAEGTLAQDGSYWLRGGYYSSWGLDLEGGYEQRPVSPVTRPLGGSDVRGYGRLSLPLRRGKWSAYLTGQADVYRFFDNLAYRLSPSLQLGYGGLSLSGTYKRSFGSDFANPTSEGINSRLSYRLPALWPVLGGALVSGNASYDAGSGHLDRYGANVYRSMGGAAQLSLGVTRNEVLGSTGLQVGLTLNLNSTRVRGGVRQAPGGGETVFQTGVAGSMAYDASTGGFVPHRRQWAGRAGALLRLYADHDSDGEKDADEPYVGGRIDVPTAARITDESGATRLHDLIPYEEYTAEVKTKTLDRPMLVPQDRRFSFMAAPGSFELIEVPLYPATTVTGRVEMKRGRGAGGLAVEIVEMTDSGRGFSAETQTFSGGAFYLNDVPPGRYEVRLASEQLSRRGLRARVAQRQVVIAPGRDVAPLRFALRVSETDAPEVVTAPALIEESAPSGSPDR